MTVAELIEFLKENLHIEIDSDKDYDTYSGDPSHSVNVSVSIWNPETKEFEVISTDSCYLS